MEIRRLKLSGFKSFVDSTELRIEPGLTGIVGPNGCGKSNLLEAIRWVMGEASARAMRGAGMDDVIFAGTATRPQRDFAEVMLLAQRDPGESLPTFDHDSDGELEIVRRIERGAGSAYRANGRDVRAKDVALLFADAATGAHSPALVSQGKIAAVIAARPQERRAMLEEAAGIAGLHVRRKDAESKLRSAEANLVRLDEVLADMDQRAQMLRRQARAAERYTRLSGAMRLAEARLLFMRWREAANAADAAQHEADQAQHEVTRAHEAQAASADHAAAAGGVLDAARAAAQHAREAVSEASHRLTALRAERDRAVGRLSELGAQAERIAADRQREGQLAEDAVTALARLSDEMAMLDARIAQAGARLPDCGARVAEARESAREAELDLARAMADQAREQAELRVAEAALAAARNRLERAGRDLERAREQAAQLPDPAPLETGRDEASRDAEQGQALLDIATAALARARDERTGALRTRGDAESALSTAQAALAALGSEAAALTGDLGRDRATGTSGRALDAVRAAPGYERALAAALGDDLQASLDAQAATHWAGAARDAGDPALPAGMTPLADHVTAPAELTRRLTQIGVAEHDEGQSLAVGQRLVTRDGQMRRWDGYVAREGGASTAQRLTRLNRLEQIAIALPLAERAASEAQQTRDRAESRLGAADATLGRLDADRDAAERSIATALRRHEDALAAIARLSTRAAEAHQRLADARTDHMALLAEHDAAVAARAAMPDGLELDEQVARLSALSDRTREHVSRLQADATLIERARATDGERRAAAQAEIKSWQSRAGEAARRVADMAGRAQAIEVELGQLGELPGTLDAAILALDADLAGISANAGHQRVAEQIAERALRESEAMLAAAGEAFSTARELRAGALARADSARERRVELARACGDRFECPPASLPEKIGFDSAGARTAAAEQAELERMTLERERIGPVNLIAAQELAEMEAHQEKSRADSAELTQAIHQLRGSIGSLNREGRTRLLAAFEAVDRHFQHLFTALFSGGQARLELVESDDPLEAGLEILAQPPGKRLTTLTLLSGGEQALTAIALIFALFLTNPAPICVLDEVDAPLDDANVERFCDLLDQMVRDTSTRYLIVTHNAVTMARMHRLFGVTMVEKGISRLVSVDLGGAEQLLAAE